MRNIIFIIAILSGYGLAAAACNSGAVETGDTVRIFDNPQSLTIIENPEGVNVILQDNDGRTVTIDSKDTEGRTVHTSSRFNRVRTDCCGNWDFISGGFTFGFVSTPGTASSLSPDLGKSIEIGWLNVAGLERRLTKGWWMSVGVGIDWRNYRSTSGLIYELNDGRVEVTPEMIEGYRFSRIKVFSVQFPIMWRKQFKSRGGMSPEIGFGGILNCNPHGSIKTSWKDESGKNRSVSSNDIGQRRFTIDLYGRLTLGDVGVYVRYSPYKLLTRSTHLDYRPLSFGIVLFY